VWRDKCIREDKDYYWCSIDRIYSHRFAECEKECPLVARDLVKNEPRSRTHTACVIAMPGIRGYYPKHSEIKRIVELHNQARASVDPPAADMRPVEWDIGLARLAQRWAESGISAHDCKNCRVILSNRSISVGQNSFFGLDMHHTTSFWNIVFSAWESEKQFFNYGTDSTDYSYL
jgi:hypothetical protein